MDNKNITALQKEKANTLFDGGYNCCQAVLLACQGELGIDEAAAAKIASGFGAGMGRLQEVCGAVTGAFMALGLALGSKEPNDGAAKERVYQAVQEFNKQFCNKHGSILCKDLLGVNLTNGDKSKNSLRVDSVCPGLVGDAVLLLGDILAASDK